MNGSAPRRPASTDWARIDAALDELITLPAAQRAAAAARIAGDDAAFARELASLARWLDGHDALLDRPAAELLQPAAAVPGLAVGTRLGPWRICGLLGRGGMGEVYRAERADGQFEQQVAIKLMRLDAATQGARFRAERQIVARLEHPGIARLLDGDVSADGRPAMVMELVDGQHLTDWCAAHRPGLARRLALFIEVCDALAYAHRHLVVHRDLKPANVLVTAEGRVKLLDFGIARLLDAPTGSVTQEPMLTPGYAAPEQFDGSAITTATDVYALGLLLHELLCGAPAFEVRHLPPAAAMQQVLTQSAPAPSRVAGRLKAPPVAASRLAGDLDAIVAKALRKAPAQRYANVDEMRLDVERHLRHEPVLARRGTWAYVASLALRRHRGWAAGLGIALLSIAAGTGAVAWQARVARDEAERAITVKNFLLQVFKASDPRVAADKPRGQATVRELLDASAARIERDFAAQPRLQLELLGAVAGIYRELDASASYDRLQRQRMSIARSLPELLPELEVEIGINQAEDALDALDAAAARKLLTQLDGTIRRAGLDASKWRARWWLLEGESLADVAGTGPRRQAALDEALRRYQRDFAGDYGRVETLDELGTLALDAGRPAQAVERFRQALALADRADEPNDGVTGQIWDHLGDAQRELGDAAGTRASYAQAMAMAQRTYGTAHGSYWVPAAALARTLHAAGDRAGAQAGFDALLATLPSDPADDHGALVALADYARCLASEGRPAAALPWLERAEASFAKHGAARELLALRRALGDAYDQLGREGDARRALQAAVDGPLAGEAADSAETLAARERWARFLAAHGESAAARPLFESVLARDHERHLVSAALAQAGLAHIALAQGEAANALEAARDAMARWAEVRGFRDVRTGAYLQRIHARALLAVGDRAGAQSAAAAALADSRRHDAPDAASIAEAQALLSAAAATPARPPQH